MINISTVLVAALAAFVVGFLWHGPLFGNQWMKLMGISKAEVEAAKKKGMGPMVPNMIGAFVQQIVVAGVLSHLANALGLSDAAQAVIFAVLIWFGFIATTLSNSVLWEKGTVSLYLFRNSYYLVSLIVVSLIVVLWK